MEQSVLEPRARGRRTAAGEQDARTWSLLARESFDSVTGLVALALVAVQAVWRGVSVSRGYFTQEDFLHLRLAHDTPLDLTHVAELHSGEFSPVAKLLTWGAVQLGGTGWGVVTVFVVLLQLVVALLLWVVLSQLLPDRWVRLPVFAVALFTPLTLASTLGWQLAAMYLPAAAALLVAASALLARQQEGWRHGGRVAVLAVAVALLCSDRTLVMPLVLFFLLAVVREPSSMRIVARLRATAQQHAVVWASMVVLVAARVAYAAVTGKGSFGLPDDSGTSISLVEDYLRLVLTGLVGGPWHGDFMGGGLEPSNRLVFAASVLVAVAVGLVFLRCVRRPVVATALVGVLVCVAASVAVVWFATQVVAFGVGVRHTGDAALLFVLLGAAGLREVTVPPKVASLVTSLPAVSAVALAVVAIASAAVTSRVLAPSLQNLDDRAYVEAMQVGLDANPQTVLLDGSPPEGVLHPWFGDLARVSTIAGLLPQQPTFGLPSEYLRIVDGGGHMRIVDLAETVPAVVEAEGCEHSVTQDRTVIQLAAATPEEEQVISFGYLVGVDTFAEVEVSGEMFRVPLHKGLKAVQIPVTGGFSQFTMTLESSAGETVACLAQVMVGTPTAGAYGGSQ